jgi:hypothetical protein
MRPDVDRARSSRPRRARAGRASMADARTRVGVVLGVARRVRQGPAVEVGEEGREGRGRQPRRVGDPQGLLVAGRVGGLGRRGLDQAPEGGRALPAPLEARRGRRGLARVPVLPAKRRVANDRVVVLLEAVDPPRDVRPVDHVGLPKRGRVANSAAESTRSQTRGRRILPAKQFASLSARPPKHHRPSPPRGVPVWSVLVW